MTDPAHGTTGTLIRPRRFVGKRRDRWVRALGRFGRRVAIGLLALVLLLTLASSGYDLATRDTAPVPPLDAHGHTIRTGDLTTHYEQWGTRGTAIVLVHGFLESGSTWDATGAILGRTHRVFALDVRGYGYTERVGPYTLGSDTEQLKNFLVAMHLDKAQPMLVGHSSGAAIIGNLARLNPGLSSRIVFMDGDGTPYGVGPAWVHRLVVDPYATAAIRLATRHNFLSAAAYRSACGSACPPFDAGLWLRPFRVHGAVAALKNILGQQLIGLTYAQEESVRTPAAVLFGAQDPQMTAEQAAQTAVRLHTSEVVTIPGAHHLGMISDPAAVAADLDRLDR